MLCLEVSGVVWPVYGSLGFRGMMVIMWNEAATGSILLGVEYSVATVALSEVNKSKQKQVTQISVVEVLIVLQK
jgi:hypothetical protein